jgi:hypothetical protein
LLISGLGQDYNKVIILGDKLSVNRRIISFFEYSRDIRPRKRMTSGQQYACDSAEDTHSIRPVFA